MTMKLTLTQTLTLRFLSNDNKQGSLSEVLLANQTTGTVIQGHVLEAALECGDRWLLFVTSDTPDEEFLRVYLLDKGGRLLDSAAIGGMYSTGSFSGLRLDPPHTVHFRFIDQADWSVIVRESPRWALPWWPEARGVWRGRRIRRYFDVCRSPRNESGRTSL